MESISTEEMILDDLMKSFHRFFGMNIVESAPIKRAG
jgi:homoserine kinase type II